MMLANIFFSFILIPQIISTQFNFDGFLTLTETASQNLDNKKLPYRVYTEYLDVETTANSIIAVDAVSGKILYQKNPLAERSIASITKLMTALVFLDYNPGWTKEVYTISSDRRGGNIDHLIPGEVLTIRNLFNTALIASDNDAVVALARLSNFTENEFVEKMNLKAKTLGLQHTIFVDPTGLLSGNKSTAEDVVKLLEVAMQNEDIKKTTSTDYYEYDILDKEKNKIRTVKLQNTDNLLNSYLQIVGGKTGFLEEAGYCLAVKIKGPENQEIYIVVLGSASNFDRFQDVKAVADWVFSNYQWK